MRKCRLRNPRQALNDAERLLLAADVPDARLDAELLLSHVLGMPRLTMLCMPPEALSEAQEGAYEALIARRAAGEPLQYVLGEAHFMGHAFHVDARVLIPRGDTETLCEAAIARLKEGGAALEIGVGSGAVAVSIALACHGAAVTGVDISEDALAVARMNGEALGARVEWLRSDLFSALEGRTFTVIVSNPPYIRSGELRGLQREVRREPPLALDGGPDGLSFYRAIVRALPGRLLPGGSLLFEVGDGQAGDVLALMGRYFSRMDRLRDMRGLTRVVVGDGYAG